MTLELADIFREYAQAYRLKHDAHLLPSHRLAMRAIERCRTEHLGGQLFRCTACGELRYSYHSCRNRHCPKCQHAQTQDWLEVQRDLLLPTPYFFLTFTLPAGLRELSSRNQKLIYALLFRASAHATQRLARDPRYLGAQIGMVGVLHTWTRSLFYHPHVHYLVPAGGLNKNDQTWTPASQSFFLPVRALSKLFKAAFRRALQDTTIYSQIPSQVWRQEWVVHCKPVGNGQAALKYLAPYIHRVAISNHRLIAFEPKRSLETARVTFQYRTSDTGQLKVCTLSAEHFIQRFLQHVLPRGFVKVRYFGFLGAAMRSSLRIIQQQLGDLPADPPSLDETTPRQPAPRQILCPHCAIPMLFQRELPRSSCRSP